jgi:hypothetical protein
LKEAHDDGAGLQRLDLCERRRLNFQQHAGGIENGRGLRVELNPLEQRVGEVAALAGAALHVEGDALLHELGRDVGCQGDACLVGKGLLQHTDTEWHPTLRAVLGFSVTRCGGATRQAESARLVGER